MSGGWIGVDLDGTLAHYDRWRGIDHVGDPVPAMMNRVKEARPIGRSSASPFRARRFRPSGGGLPRRAACL